jgi:NADH:ubiquinone oxidoreductase subunit 5 (subunit L)/multisubunit Na+/H+ antiporter MnhA subunit
MLVTAGSLARAYRTREIASMSGAWRRMRRTSLSLGLWALAAGGLDLVGYDLVSTIFLNRFPNGGHMAGWVQVLVALLAITAIVLTALYAVRLVAAVCAGSPVARRGFMAERLTEAEPRLRGIQAWSAAGTVAAVLIGLPGISGIGQGKGRVPALTFSRWIYFGTGHQALPLSWAALGVAVAVLLVGGGGGLALARLGGARLWSRLRIPAAAAAAPAAVGWAIRLAARAGDTLAGEVVALDHGLVEPLYDAPGEGVEIVAWSLSRVRVRRLRIGLGVALVLVLLLVGASVLAAGGQLPVHTT